MEPAGFDFQVSAQMPPAGALTFTPMNLTGSSPQGVVDMNGDYLDDMVIPPPTSFRLSSNSPVEASVHRPSPPRRRTIRQLEHDRR
ncbi:MAG: hypothetical protein R2810_03520 [Flavobacteriales bacterium]